MTRLLCALGLHAWRHDVWGAMGVRQHCGRCWAARWSR